MNNGIGISPVSLGTDSIGRDRSTFSSIQGTQDAASSIRETSISDAVKSVGADFASTLRDAEATSAAGLKGEASAYQVASSVMEAEQALRMTVAVRDRVVQAYLEISRMQI